MATKQTYPDFTPAGVHFQDLRTGVEFILVEGGAWDGWLVYLHYDRRNWVSYRKATDDEKKRIHLLQCNAYIENCNIKIYLMEGFI